jgi:hypothetical protein
VVHYRCIAFHNTVHVQIAPESGIGDLGILEALDGSLDCFCSCAAGLEESHGYLGGTGTRQLRLSMASENSVRVDELAARRKVNALIRVAMVACAGMHEDGGDIHGRLADAAHRSWYIDAV